MRATSLVTRLSDAWRTGANRLPRRRVLMFAAILAVFSVQGRAAGLFKPCEQVASQSKKAHDVLLFADVCMGDDCVEEFRADRCLLLDSHRLIYNDVTAGTSWQGLYLVDLDQQESEPGRLTATVGDIKEYVSSKGQRFALIEDGLMQHGQFWGGLQIFELTPDEKPGYLVTSLVEQFNNEGCATDDEAEGCGLPDFGLWVYDRRGKHAEIRSRTVLPWVRSVKALPSSRQATALVLDIGMEEGRSSCLLRYEISGTPPRFGIKDFEKSAQCLRQLVAKP